VRRLIIGLLSFFFLWDFQALDRQRQARIVLVRYSGDHPHHYGSCVAVAAGVEFMPSVAGE
jgi:hypothetical protein